MKQSLSTRLATLCAAIVISTVVLESVAELGYPAPVASANVGQAVASATSATSTSAKSQPL